MPIDPNENLVWIKTQDGSPTLWNNEVGEPYRSVKGAFHESLLVFVKPAIAFAKNLKPSQQPIVLCEFGLGAGTNWVFFSSLAKHFEIPIEYHAIEKDPSAFALSLKKWESLEPLIEDNISKHIGLKLAVKVRNIEAPIIYPSLGACLDAFITTEKKSQIWFHDPFGSGVNPDGYSQETLSTCSKIWDEHNLIGLSYACNGSFQRVLRDLGVMAKSVELNSPPLKRDSLIFYRN